MSTVNSFGTRTALMVGSRTYQMFSLPALQREGFPEIARLPFSLKILLENLLRHEDGRFVKAADVEALARWDVKSAVQKEISFAPARVLLQDFTGVPAVVDLAAMRDGIARLGGDPNKVNPLQPVELVIDHSVQVDYFGQANAFQLNAELEFARNKERYAFLRWGQDAFDNFRVVPPDTGIVHQVNLEYLARVIMSADSGDGTLCFPDTLVGTDSHTTMVNGLGVMGWGVGGIEAEAAMLGQPISMLIPQVLGFRLVGTMLEGATATDLVLTITEKLRKHGVVGKFVEFFGPGLEHLTIADRATLGNMCPEYGATIAIFPIDDMTLDYLSRDYLAAGWTGDVLGARTTEHPLQPFSRRYFEAPEGVAPGARPHFTYAREWRVAHAPARPASAFRVPTFQPNPDVPITVVQLANFLKNPVKHFFSHRLGVVFPDIDHGKADDEAFALDGLDEYGLLDDVLKSLGRVPDGMLPSPGDVRRLVAERVRRIERTGRLPHATFGRRKEAELIETLVPMLDGWHQANARYPNASPKEPLRFAQGDLVLGDWLDGLRAHEDKRAWLELLASKLCAEVNRKAVARPDKMLTAWVRTLVSSACGVAAHGLIVGRDATLTVDPLPQDEATRLLQDLLDTWRAGMDEPLPLACRTALACVGDAGDIAGVYEGRHTAGYAEVREPCLARVYPDFDALTACGRFEQLSKRLYGPLHAWVGEHVHPAPHGRSTSDAIVVADKATQTLEAA